MVNAYNYLHQNNETFQTKVFCFKALFNIFTFTIYHYLHIFAMEWSETTDK